MRRGQLRTPRSRVATSATVALVAALAAPVAAAVAGAAGQALDARLFGASAHIEVVPLASAEATRDALADALEAARRIEQLTALESGAGVQPFAGGVSTLNQRAGQGAVPVDPDLLVVLARALEYCAWSRQAHGPLGRALNLAWGVREGEIDRELAATDPVVSARCDRLTVDGVAQTADLRAGSGVDLWGFERGYAVDHAVEVLEKLGVESGWVQIGRVTRAFGGGPAGRGWPMAVDPTAGRDQPTERVLLRNRALAMASPLNEAIERGAEHLAPYLHQVTGLPVRDKVAVLAVAERALDAEALAVSLFLLGSREGEFYLGAVRPAPAVKWFLGDGQSAPLVSQRGWSSLERWDP